MRRIIKWMLILVMIYSMFAIGVLVGDKYTLGNQIIRLRVVGASDLAEDQRIKLQVRDSVNAFLQESMPERIRFREAKQFLTEHLSEIEQAAKDRLKQLGENDTVSVYLTREAADTCHYDTFSLPAGVYETLRVDIGKATGKNWWCVVFPSFCMPTTSEGFEEEAVSCGINDVLTETLSADGGYKIRFWILDLFGRIEKIIKSL